MINDCAWSVRKGPPKRLAHPESPKSVSHMCSRTPTIKRGRESCISQSRNACESHIIFLRLKLRRAQHAHILFRHRNQIGFLPVLRRTRLQPLLDVH